MPTNLLRLQLQVQPTIVVIAPFLAIDRTYVAVAIKAGRELRHAEQTHISQ